MIKIVKVEKSQDIFITFKSQTLTSFIFKCDLNFMKWMWIHTRDIIIVKTDKMVKSQNVNFDFKSQNLTLTWMIKWSFYLLTKVSGLCGCLWWWRQAH